jgi:hypothetical protein
MATYSIQGPDGRTYSIEGPAGASREQVIAEIQRQNGGKIGAKRSSAAGDIAKSGGTGILKGAANLMSVAEMASPQGMANTWLNALGVQTPQTAGQASQNAIAKYGHKPETRAGRYAESIGENVVNALAPGGPIARVASVVLPGVMGEGAREAAESAGMGETGQTVAKAAGGIAGGLGASVRGVPRLPSRQAVPLPRQSANELAARAAEYRAAGIQPTLIDVGDDTLRGVVRAGASRNTPARQRATDFQDARQLGLPDRMSGQARRTMSQDPRTPDQIRAEMSARRSQNANQAFGAVRGDLIDVPPEAVQAMQTPYGRRAVAEAANRERDPQVRQALASLVDQLDDPNGVKMSVGMADRISRVLLSSARANANDPDLAATYTQLGESIRGPAREVSPGYARALEGYAADSRLKDAAGVGEDLLTRNTDEFVPQAQNLSDEERALALASGRRAIERASGESIGAAPGVARRIALAPEQQARNAALMGPERAQQLQQGMRLEERAVRNANDIAPRFGTQTQNKQQDAAGIASAVAQRGGQVMRGDPIGAAWGVGMDWLKSRGMNDQQAEALVNMALDPAQTDRAIQIIAQRFGPQAAQQAINWRNAVLLGSAAVTGASAPSASQ